MIKTAHIRDKFDLITTIPYIKTHNKFKVFMAVFLPIAILINIILWLFYVNDIRTNINLLKVHSKNIIELQSVKIGNNFNYIVSDLMFFANYNQLFKLLDGSEIERDRLINDFVLFSRGSKIYDQIRILDISGMEKIRINFVDDKPVIINEKDLQNKGDRYYFKDTFNLNKGEVFISPFDLNIENGKIERPIKPMIRFGTPIFNRKGIKQGIIIFNYLGAQLIDKIKNLSTGAKGYYMLVNSESYWIIGRDKNDEWTFMYKDKLKHSMSNVFSDAWNKISSKEKGQFYNSNGIFSFTTIYPLLETWKSSTGSGQAYGDSKKIRKAKEYFWKIISFLPEKLLKKERSVILFHYISLGIIIILILGIGSWLLASLSIKRDISLIELSKRTNELEEANIKLKQKDKHKTEFLANMSHELRTPLNSIIGFSSIMLMGISGDLNKEQNKQLGMVKNSARHLLNLINDVLDISKIDAGKKDVFPEKFYIKKLIKEVVATISPMTKSKKLNIIEEKFRDIIIFSDKKLIKQILINIINNAVKYTNTGSIRIKYRKLKKEYISIKIIDTGIGIKKEDINKLFVSFKQIDMSSTKEHRGTGLGLFLSKGLITVLGGTITVKSEFGKGSEFTVKFPVKYLEKKT